MLFFSSFMVLSTANSCGDDSKDGATTEQAEEVHEEHPGNGEEHPTNKANTTKKEEHPTSEEHPANTEDTTKKEEHPTSEEHPK